MSKHKVNIIPRQKRNFTCAIAAIASVAQLLDVHFPRGTILSGVGAKPVTGTANADIVKWCKKHLPVTSVGEGTYKGGLAVANIQNQHSGIGHYVVLLGKKGDTYRYYCPLLGQIFEKKKSEIVWKSGNGRVKDWSINFKSDIDFWNFKAEPERHIFIIADPIEHVKYELDASIKIKGAYEAREQSVTWHTAENIFTKGKTLFLDGLPVLKNDLVWFRCDPLNNVHYYELLRRLCSVDARIINSPQSILTFHDKLSVNELEKSFQYTVSNEKNLLRCFRHLKTDGFKEFILKVPSRFGGDNIYKVDNYDDLLSRFEENVHDSGYVIIQGFVKMDRPVDTRVLITENKIIGVVDRVAQKGEFICNVNAGGTAEANEKLTKNQLSHVSKVQKLLSENKIFLAGVDLLGDKLIEINVSCPSGIVPINEVTGKHVEFDLIDGADKWIKKNFKGK